MEGQPNIFEVIESGDFDWFIEVVDVAFKAAREASYESHALGLEVTDGRVNEERKRRPIRPSV